MENEKKKKLPANLKKRIGWITAAAVCLIAAVFLIAFRGGKKSSASPEMMGMQKMNNVSTVRAEKPGTGNIQRTTGLSGTVEPSDVVYVYAKAAGDVTGVLVKAGDAVEAGQLICTIDTEQVETAKNSMDSAAVSLSEAQSALNRMRLLFQGGDISDQEWEQYQNKVKTAKLQYDSAKLNYERQVEYSSVTAPIGGKIESCDLEVHDRVNQSAQLCVISGEGEKRVSFYVTERVVQNLKQGDSITIVKNEASYEGAITDISTMVDETNGLFKVKAELPEVNTVATGSVVKVYVISEHAENVMTVPVDAVYYDGGVGNVYLYQDGVVHKKEVEVGLTDSEKAEIRSGLSPDDMVISTWSSQLYEGSTVKLKGEDGTEESADKEAEETGGVPDDGKRIQKRPGEQQSRADQKEEDLSSRRQSSDLQPRQEPAGQTRKETAE